MITELRVHDFHAFVNSSFRLKRQHVLIGKNTSGKTNLGLALLFSCYATTVPVADAVHIMPGGAWDFCNYSIDAKDRVSRFELREEKGIVQ